MDFPVSDFSIQALTSGDFFENLYNIIIPKIHLHHSHATGKIHGFAITRFERIKLFYPVWF